jgi:hypothetical protein
MWAIRIFFHDEFSPLHKKRKKKEKETGADESDKGIFENFFFNLLYLEEKKIKSRQI